VRPIGYDPPEEFPVTLFTIEHRDSPVSARLAGFSAAMDKPKEQVDQLHTSPA
jgi:hypothetical protein